ncbi:hypothetical protein [Halocatena marina]|uniref:Uncharacterized protein n=1 Tax=Halocatena marina TaxID=2934937 RepID=A0ABD5YJ20_9EURY|nr:hypothetical protein [Halocatena marina]
METRTSINCNRNPTDSHARGLSDEQRYLPFLVTFEYTDEAFQHDVGSLNCLSERHR